MNSLVFLLIGLEIHVRELLQNWASVLLAIGAVFLGRAFSIYLLVPLSNRFAEKMPLRWQHVAVWGGLRGALALALALSLTAAFPCREQILNLTFGVVIFSISSAGTRSEEHTSELQSQSNLVCRLLLEKKKTTSHLQAGCPGERRPTGVSCDEGLLVVQEFILDPVYGSRH